jgi:hypothetical protein
MAWEPVYTVNDYYDRPRLGVAEYSGKPHIYDSTLEGLSDEYAEHYLLSPIDDDLLQLILQDWEIWQRWTAAYTAGEVSLDSHPALPEDTAAHEELQARIGERLQADRGSARCVWAQFRSSATAAGGLDVQWFESEDAWRASAA